MPLRNFRDKPRAGWAGELKKALGGGMERGFQVWYFTVRSGHKNPGRPPGAGPDKLREGSPGPPPKPGQRERAMRVAVLAEVQRISLEERAEPVPGPGEVVVAVSHCGICGSDVHGFLHGIVVKPGTVMGHECVGRVAQVGEGVRGWLPGDRVAVKPTAECGSCHYCRRGQLSLCPEAFQKGLGVVPGADGAFAGRVRIRRPERMLYRLPDEISFQEAVLTEPLATALHGVRLSRFQPGDSAVVIGAGTIGLGVIQFLRLGGARKIVAIEPSAKKRALARRLGADEALNPSEQGAELRKPVLDLTGGLGADLVFECSGVPGGLQASCTLVKRGGRIMLVGVNEQEVSLRPFLLSVWEIEMKGVFCYYDEFPLVLDFLQQGRIDAAAMLSEVIPLERIQEDGFLRLSRDPDLVKVAVAMEAQE